MSVAGTRELRRAVRSAADEIYDPCSVAAAQPLGIAELGLVRDVRLARGAGDRFDVTVVLRLTAPGCLYWIYFERELRARVGTLPGVASVTVARDPAYDWTEDDIAPDARRRLRERRRRRRA